MLLSKMLLQPVNENIFDKNISSGLLREIDIYSYRMINTTHGEIEFIIDHLGPPSTLSNKMRNQPDLFYIET